MAAVVQTLLFMLAVLAAVAVAAKRLNIAPSILLVVAGIGMALIPSLPKVTLAPEVVLLVILPPLIYSAGFAMSWREFKFNLRPIALLAFGCVIFTACAVAAAAHYLLGFQWAVAFVLGAIVAPPDAVAPLAIARRLGMPRRLLVVLEGEGLANDATALILYRFAVAAAVSGTFSLEQAAGTFALIVVGEIVFGIGVGWLSLRLRKWAQEPRVEITLSLLTPYVAYWLPEHFGGSGVLATVACGLYVSWNGPLLIPPATRLQGVFFWNLIVYLIEGLVFLLTGLQARTLIEQGHGFSIRELAIATAADHGHRDRRALCLGISGHLHSTLDRPRPAQARSVAALAGPVPDFVHRRARRGVARRRFGHSVFSRQRPAVSASRHDPIRRLRRHRHHVGRARTGVAERGALARPQPSRPRGTQSRDQKRVARAPGRVEKITKRLERYIKTHKLPKEMIAHLRTRNQSRLQILPSNLTDSLDHLRQTAALKRDLIKDEREYIYRLLRDGKITDEARRRIEYELDLEEASVANRAQDGGGWM